MSVAIANDKGHALGDDDRWARHLVLVSRLQLAHDRVCALVDSPALGTNIDTGNSFLSGNDPHEWLEAAIDDVVHVHAKDISAADAERYRGKVRGMLGCACGDGVIDWARVVETCRRAPRDLVLSVECGSTADAERSLEHLVSVGAEIRP